MKFSLGLVLISSVILGCSGNAVESRTPALIQSAAKVEETRMPMLQYYFSAGQKFFGVEKLTAMRISKDGKRLAFVYDALYAKGKVSVMTLDPLNSEFTIQRENLKEYSFSDDSKYLFLINGLSIEKYDVENRRVAEILAFNIDSQMKLKVSKDNDYAFTSTSGSIEIFDLKSHADLVARKTGTFYNLDDVVLTKNLLGVLTAKFDQTSRRNQYSIEVSDFRTQKIIYDHLLEKPSSPTFRISSDENWLAVQDGMSCIHLINLKTAQKNQACPANDQIYTNIDEFDFSPDSSLLMYTARKQGSGFLSTSSFSFVDVNKPSRTTHSLLEYKAGSVKPVIHPSGNYVFLNFEENSYSSKVQLDVYKMFEGVPDFATKPTAPTTPIPTIPEPPVSPNPTGDPIGIWKTVDFMYSCRYYTNIACIGGEFSVSQTSDVVTVAYKSGQCQSAHPGISGILKFKRTGNELLDIDGKKLGTFYPMSFYVNEYDAGGRNVSLMGTGDNNISIKFKTKDPIWGDEIPCHIDGSVKYK